MKSPKYPSQDEAAYTCYPAANERTDDQWIADGSKICPYPVETVLNSVYGQLHVEKPAAETVSEVKNGCDGQRIGDPNQGD